MTFPPDETPREHVANAIQILRAITAESFESRQWIEDLDAVCARLIAALAQLPDGPARRLVLSADHAAAKWMIPNAIVFAEWALAELDKSQAAA